jgi:hypothetical protein
LGRSATDTRTTITKREGKRLSDYQELHKMLSLAISVAVVAILLLFNSPSMTLAFANTGQPTLTAKLEFNNPWTCFKTIPLVSIS